MCSSFGCSYSNAENHFLYTLERHYWNIVAISYLWIELQGSLYGRTIVRTKYLWAENQIQGEGKIYPLPSHFHRKNCPPLSKWVCLGRGRGIASALYRLRPYCTGKIVKYESYPKSNLVYVFYFGPCYNTEETIFKENIRPCCQTLLWKFKVSTVKWLHFVRV